MQELNKFKLPKNFRGKSAITVQLWWFVSYVFFKPSPQFLYGWRRLLLRLFGAKIGKKVIIRPTATITYPWKLEIGDYSWIGDEVVLYTLGKIAIGNNSVVSQRSYICTGSHDYSTKGFVIYEKPIVIEDGCWIATDVFVGPGVTIKKNTVVGSRSSVYKDLPSNSICVGNPAKVIKERKFEKQDYFN